MTGEGVAERAPAARRAGGPREFVADNIIVAAAQVLGQLRGIVTLPLIVKSMGAASYGVWSQVLTFSNVALAVLGFSLHIPLVRLLSESYGNVDTSGAAATDTRSGRTSSTGFAVRRSARRAASKTTGRRPRSRTALSSRTGTRSCRCCWDPIARGVGRSSAG